MKRKIERKKLQRLQIVTLIQLEDPGEIVLIMYEKM